MFTRHDPLSPEVTQDVARSFPPIRVNARPNEDMLPVRFTVHHQGFNP